MFREFYVVLRRFKWSVGLAVLNVFAVTALLTLTENPLYHAEAAVLVQALSGGGAGSGETLNMVTEAELVRSNVIAQRVADELNLTVPLENLAVRVDVEPVEDTEILTVGYTADSRESARVRAQAFAEAYLAYRSDRASTSAANVREAIEAELDALNERLAEVNQQLLTAEADEVPPLQAQLNLISNRIVDRQLQLTEVRAVPDVGTIIRAAAADPRPVSPDPIRNGVIGLLGGLILGAAVAALRDQFDTRVRDTDDVTGVVGPMLVLSIPRHRRFSQPGTAQDLLSAMDGQALNGYRALAIEVGLSVERSTSSALVVSGVEEGAGASTVATVLAIMLARTERRVVLVSADARHPVLESLFRARTAPGLADVVAGRAKLAAALAPTTVPGLAIMPIGSDDLRSPEMLATARMAEIIESLTEAFDVVIFDTAPIGEQVDAFGLIAPGTQTLLVVPAGVPRAKLIHTDRQLRQVSARVIGAVLTQTD